jgi:hypothetical protein
MDDATLLELPDDPATLRRIILSETRRARGGDETT